MTPALIESALGVGLKIHMVYTFLSRETAMAKTAFLRSGAPQRKNNIVLT